jgi:hypothetical protein
MATNIKKSDGLGTEEQLNQFLQGEFVQMPSTLEGVGGGGGGGRSGTSKTRTSAVSTGDNPITLRDERGNITGMEQGGRVILTGPRDAQNLLRSAAGLRTAPTGTLEAAEVAKQNQINQQIAQNAALAGQLGETGTLTPAGLETPNLAQAATLAAGSINPQAALTGAAGGALAGSSLGPIGMIVGAIAGSLGASYLVGVRNNIRNQLSEIQSTKTQSFSIARSNLNKIVRDTNANPAHGAENLQMFNEQLRVIDEKELELNAETNRDLNKFLNDDNIKEIERFEVFNSAGGERELLIIKMREALVNPDPNKVSLSEDEIETLEEGLV